MNAILLLTVCVAGAFADSHMGCPVDMNLTSAISAIKDMKEAYLLEVETAKSEIFYKSAVTDGKQYLLSKEPVRDVAKAIEYCSDIGGYLVEIVDKLELELLKLFISSIPDTCLEIVETIRISGLYKEVFGNHYFHGTEDFTMDEFKVYTEFVAPQPVELSSRQCLVIRKIQEEVDISPYTKYVYESSECVSLAEPKSHFICELDVNDYRDIIEKSIEKKEVAPRRERRGVPNCFALQCYSYNYFTVYINWYYYTYNCYPSWFDSHYFHHGYFQGIPYFHSTGCYNNCYLRNCYSIGSIDYYVNYYLRTYGSYPTWYYYPVYY